MENNEDKNKKTIEKWIKNNAYQILFLIILLAFIILNIKYGSNTEFVGIILIILGFTVLLFGHNIKKETTVDIYTLKSAYLCVFAGVFILILLIIKDIICFYVENGLK